jgi:hypothetical protein
MIAQMVADIRFDGKALRPTSAVQSFPWLVKLVTLVRVTPDGAVTQAKSDAEKRSMLGESDENDLVLAAWPGDWSQDVFVVDDLKGARVSVGLPRHKVTPATASPPPAGTYVQRDYVPPVGLWQRLAESPGLSLEGQHQIAAVCGSRFTGAAALALLARADLDREAREDLLNADGHGVPEALVASGQLTGDEIAALIDRYPDSGDLYQAALCSPEGGAAAQRKVASLSFGEAAHVWMYSHIWSKKRPELAAEILPTLLAAPASPASSGMPGDSRDERSSVIRSVASGLLPEQRLEFLRNPVRGHLLQRALLDDKSRDPLTDEELVACVPEITQPQEHLSAGSTPEVIRFLQRFPRLADLAQPRVERAVLELGAVGWSPTQCAQSSQWDVLMSVARIAEAASLLNDLALASVHDRGASGGPHQQRWHDPRRYDLVEVLLNKPRLPDTSANHVLDRLGESELDDIAASAAVGSRLEHLCASAINRRSPHVLPASTITARRPAEKLPSDEDLSKVDDPQAVLLDLIKSRGMDQDRKVRHALGSAYMTDDLAWRLPAKSLESHPVYGPRLAAQIAEICGDSPIRWQEFVSSWSQPTQLLASSLFKRLRKAAATG